MSAEVKLDPEIQSDLGSLSRPVLEEAFSLMVKLKRTPYLGQPLGDHPEIGDLSDCYKLYFDEARHRIIYQVETPSRIRIIAVGRRASLGVYRAAARRLGRTPGVDAPEN